MKKFLLCMMAFMLMVVLFGCTKDVELHSETEKVPNVELLSGEEISKNMISSNLLGQTVYDTLQAEWDAWNTKTEEQKMFSSHMPGHCYVNFDTWEECEEFLGFEVFQPLEDSDFEKGNYVGMPEGYNDASHIHVSFFGTSEGKVEWIQLESGYRNGDVRITVTAHINEIFQGRKKIYQFLRRKMERDTWQ